MASPNTIFVLLFASVFATRAIQSQTAGYVVLKGIQNGPADVFVDGVARGRLVNQELTLTVAIGSHAVAVSREGYSEFRTSVVVKAGDVVAVEVLLVRKAVRVVEDSPQRGQAVQLQARIRIVHLEPLNVTVAFDGGIVGSTPLTLDVPAGEVQLKVGANPLCLRTRAFDTAFVRIRQDQVEELRNVWRCGDPMAPPAQPLAPPVAVMQSPAALARWRDSILTTEFEASLSQRSGVASFAECALAADGAPYCRGWDDPPSYGLGFGKTRTKYDRFTLLPGVPSLKTLVHRNAFCGISNDDRVYCWGGGHGPSLSSDDLPHMIDLPVRTASVDVNMGAGCAVGVDQSVYCWGFGPVGRKVSANRVSPPQPIESSEHFAQVAVQPYSACGLTVSGSVLCWGTFGSGRRKPSETPGPIESAAKFKRLWRARDDICAETTGGETLCWGDKARPFPKAP